MATNDFKAFANGVGANVLSQSDFVALTSLISNGFQSGTADSEQLNKVWRQSSVMASVIGDLIVKLTGEDVLDNGTPETIVTNLQMATLYSTIATAVGGTANAITATFPFVPGVSDLIDGMTFHFKAASSSTSGTPTFTPNNGTIPAKTIVKGDDSPLAIGDILANMWVQLTYDSSLDKWVINNPATGISTTGSSSISGLYKNLKTNSVGVNNYNCVITADEVILKNASGNSYLATSVNKTINANGVVGAPLSIMSTRVASTWYYRWLWYNSVSGLTATLDISSTSPTAPTGYSSSDYKALLPGADRTDSSGSTYLLQIITRGKRSIYVPLSGSNLAKLPSMVSGVQGSVPSTFVSVSTANFVPPAAESIKVAGWDTSGTGIVIIAPNNTYSYQVGATINGNPSPYQFNGSGTSASGSVPAEFLLESTNIFVISGSSSAVVNCVGWEDNF